MLNELDKSCKDIIADNNVSQMAAIQAYQTIINDLDPLLKKEDLTEAERVWITNRMFEAADKIAELNSENKEFLGFILKHKDFITTGALLVGAAILGVHIKGKLPQIKNKVKG